MPPPNRGGGDSWVSDEDAYKYPDSPAPLSRHRPGTATDSGTAHFDLDNLDRFLLPSLTMAPSVIDPVLQSSSDDMRLRHNPKDAPWVVQKFGGTSIGKFAESIALDIVRYATLSFWPTELCLTQFSQPRYCKR